MTLQPSPAHGYLEGTTCAPAQEGDRAVRLQKRRTLCSALVPHVETLWAWASRSRTKSTLRPNWPSPSSRAQLTPQHPGRAGGGSRAEIIDLELGLTLCTGGELPLGYH